ncbi:MAG: hypothetical protein A2283_18530 [Lentisphaerae bacterium RIFOXYA12_FULL_48_11]|nr:MAG: hypothetical protein A2283_18530 [Lentisphaerae bacterium RIFOXYA12_FULL_48_11]
MKLKRIFASILCLLFVVGMLIVPTIHMIHCADSGDVHETTQCSFCQLANTPVMESVSHVEPTDQIISVDYFSIPQLFILSALLRGPTQARAPPVA